MSRLICPLRLATASADELSGLGLELPIGMAGPFDCLEDRCAWWTGHSCAVLGMGAIGDMLERERAEWASRELQLAGNLAATQEELGRVRAELDGLRR